MSADSGTYSCAAVNSITSAEIKMPDKTTINVEYNVKSSPTFLEKQSTHIAVKPGTTTILECPGVGNPVPKAVWSRPDANIFNNRTTVLSYGLQLIDVRPEDRGTYICRLDNGIAPELIHTIRLEVQEPPVIMRNPSDTLFDEGESVELECMAKGYPIPTIYWLINGNDTRYDKAIQTDQNKLLIKSVEKRHAGIVQCFARNEVGEVYVSRLLEVNPKQIPGEVGVQPLGGQLFIHSTKSSFDQKAPKGRKKHKHRKCFGFYFKLSFYLLKKFHLCKNYFIGNMRNFIAFDLQYIILLLKERI